MSDNQPDCGNTPNPPDQEGLELETTAGETVEQGEVRSELELLQQANAELEDRLLRTQAELMNVRRRSQNELDQFRKYEGLNLVRELLPVIDNLQRAAVAAEQATDIQNLKTGVEMVSRQLLEVLDKNHVEVIASAGEAFDPNLHEAVHQQPDENIPAMHVLNVLETGYRMQDRIVRPAKVIVSTGPSSAG